MGTLALIGLGSNLGDRRAILDFAAESLASEPGVRLLSVSSYHETSPVGGPAGQGPFLNAAASLDATCGPRELLEILQGLERRAGRERIVPWGARTLDLDLLLFGDAILGRHPRLSQVEPRPNIPLQVPHPWLPFRRFVLAPASEITPDAVDPVTGRTVAQLLANLDRCPNYLALSGRPSPRMDRLFTRITSELNAIGFSIPDPPPVESVTRHEDAGRNVIEGPATQPRIDETSIDRRSAARRFLGQVRASEPWSQAVREDRWIVTDFWTEWVWERSDWKDTVRVEHDPGILPTLVAFIPPFHKDFVALESASHAMSERRSGVNNLGPPLFVYQPPLTAHDLEDTMARDALVIDPILNACRAIRAGTERSH